MQVLGDQVKSCVQTIVKKEGVRFPITSRNKHR